MMAILTDTHIAIYQRTENGLRAWRVIEGGPDIQIRALDAARSLALDASKNGGWALPFESPFFGLDDAEPPESTRVAIETNCSGSVNCGLRYPEGSGGDNGPIK